MKVLVFCSTSKPLISSYLGINAVYRNSFDSLPSELIVIAHDNLKTVESTLSQIRRRRARGTSGLWPSSP